MQLSDFHYDIPDELIAATPPAVRGTSRLLVLDRQTGTITDRYYPDVVDYLQVGDVLVINDTKVIKARLITRKPSGGERRTCSSRTAWRTRRLVPPQGYLSVKVNRWRYSDNWR